MTIDLDAIRARVEHAPALRWGSAFVTIAEADCARADIIALLAEVARLTEEIEGHAWTISPAMLQARNDQLSTEIARLHESMAAQARLLSESAAEYQARAAKAEALLSACSEALSGGEAPLDLLPGQIRWLGDRYAAVVAELRDLRRAT